MEVEQLVWTVHTKNKRFFPRAARVHAPGVTGVRALAVLKAKGGWLENLWLPALARAHLALNGGARIP